MKTESEPAQAEAAVVPFRFHEGRLEVLLITTRSGGGWTIPRSPVRPDMTRLESACKTAVDEAGVRGRPTPVPLGARARCGKGRTKPITAYPLEVTRLKTRWPEMGCRRREWVEIAEAVTWDLDEELKPILESLGEFARR